MFVRFACDIFGAAYWCTIISSCCSISKTLVASLSTTNSVASLTTSATDSIAFASDITGEAFAQHLDMRMAASRDIRLGVHGREL